MVFKCRFYLLYLAFLLLAESVQQINKKIQQIR